MSLPVVVSVEDWTRAAGIFGMVQIGHYFAYALDPAALGDGQERRSSRLHLGPPSAGRRVLPLSAAPTRLSGLTLHAGQRPLSRLGCIVADRDLYRAEQDTAYLLIATPGWDGAVELEVSCNGATFLKRELEGVGSELRVDTLSMLLAGSYVATLRVGGVAVGSPAAFTVAEYSLAPLSARLGAHQLDRRADRLSFQLEVESYQQPFDRPLKVALLDGARQVDSVTLAAASPGVYEGSLAASGAGPFRLRLTAAEDASRIAEVAIPGSRAAERSETLVSELGEEVHLSLMPAPEALPLRGAFLSRGDALNTPVVAEEVIAEEGALTFRAAAEDAALMIWDGASGALTPRPLGPVKAGAVIPIPYEGPMTTVFVGAITDGRPFEGFASFLKPPRLKLEIDAPERARPRDPVAITLKGEAGAPTPVVLTVRDRRLTATDRPEVALSASLKSRVEAVTTPLKGDFAFRSLMETLQQQPWQSFGGGAFRSQDTVMDKVDLSTIAQFRVASPLPPTPVIEALDEGGAWDQETSAPPPPRRMEALREAPMEMPRPEPLSIPSPAPLPGRAGEGMPLGGAPDLPAKRRAKGESGASGPSAGAAPEAQRDSFPEQLYYGLTVVDGEATIVVPLEDSLGTFVVEAFALRGGDWARIERTLTVDQPLRVDLDLPPSIHPGDEALGRVRAAAPGGMVRITLQRDGAPIRLGEAGADLFPSPAELSFPCQPGRWVATAEDPDTGEVDRIQVDVEIPGKLRWECRQIRLLRPGDAVDVAGPGVLGLRVLPGLDEPLRALVVATGDYSHLCCEQTAAKILSAVVMYLTCEPAMRPKAEAIVLAGIARERRMMRSYGGFRMYPDTDYFSAHYSSLAARYLLKLADLEGQPGLSAPLSRAIAEGLGMGRAVAAYHEIVRLPKHIGCAEDAWAAAADEGRWAEVGRYLEGIVDGATGATREAGGAVERRRIQSWAAAAWLRMGQLGAGLTLANAVLGDLGPQGRLYSTVDSVAAIGLLIQLRHKGVLGTAGTVAINGAQMSVAAATDFAGDVERVEVKEGTVAVEVTRLVEEDWDSWSGKVPMKVGLRTEDGGKARKIRQGDRLALEVTLPAGYRNGDLIHVDLPPALAWIKGGGRVKRFTVDLEAKDALSIPLVATASLEKPQHFAVCLRNMFEEERVGSPGLLKAGAAGWLSFLG